ncbi:GIY-YIG nuclease family protein [Roseibium sp.]|uniref:GIY-YIG nuclease family protein n=1 Tax=Roseibium sp. TaxID=1936156 RepID=UPI003266FF76
MTAVLLAKTILPPVVILGLDPGIHTVSYLRMQKRFWVYILTTRRGGTLYTGVTNNLPRRLLEHTSGTGSQFTRRYSVKRLVWYELHPSAPQAIAREKAIKHWPRAWKVELIEVMNPDWFDLGGNLNC